MEVRRARDDDEVRAAVALRHEVFVGEQQVPVAEELDGRDARAVHLVAIRDGAVVATCRLLTDGPVVLLGRLAVDAAHRRQGIAGAVLAEAERWSRARGARRIVLNAQTYARGLYEQAGYVAVGDLFFEAGIEHVRMELTLA